MTAFTPGGKGLRGWRPRLMVALVASGLTSALWMGAVAGSQGRRSEAGAGIAAATTRITLPTVYVTASRHVVERSLEQLAAGAAPDCGRLRTE
jgi:hypothetical protein